MEDSERERHRERERDRERESTVRTQSDRQPLWAAAATRFPAQLIVYCAHVKLKAEFDQQQQQMKRPDCPPAAGSLITDSSSSVLFN